MSKIFLILFIFYLLYKVGSLIFRMLFRVAVGQMPHQHQSQQPNETFQKKRYTKGDINIDYVPENGKTKKHFNGGEYVDFEEVK